MPTASSAARRRPAGRRLRTAETVSTRTAAETDSEEIPATPDGDLAHQLKSGPARRSFIIQYQPMLDLQTRGSETYEIVLRVQNAQGDLIGDRQLQDAAETHGVCEELDQWILDRAIDILKQRRESGRRTQIFVHQSAHSALNVNLPAWLLGRLRAKQVVGTGLVIDFRLPDLSQDLKIAQNTIRSLREMDVDVSLSRFPEKDAAFKVLRFPACPLHQHRPAPAQGRPASDQQRDQKGA